MSKDTNQPTPTSPIKIWVLLDDRAGNRSQCLGVADALVLGNGLEYVVREIEYNIFSALPNFIKGATFLGLTSASGKNLKLSSYDPTDWPGIVIAAGRRTANAARAIKRLSKNKTKIIQIMYPGPAGLSEFDLIAVPHHDNLDINIQKAGNILSIPGAPHKVTAALLDNAASVWRDKLKHLPSPKIAVFIGGSTRKREFSSDMAHMFGQHINQLALDTGGSLLITTSRRSGEAGQAVLSKISAPNHVYEWGNQGENPYHGYLALADIIIVSGDSVSMCSEACATKAPVYIYAPDGFVVDKHKRLHDYLYKNGFARPFDAASIDYSETWQHEPLNASTIIADEIRKRFLVK